MFCKNCGNEIAEGTKFCASCGAPVDEAPKAAEATMGDVASDSDKAARNKSATKILTLGICSVAFSNSFWLAIVGWILGGICKNKVREYEARFGPVSGKAKVGKYLGVGGFIGGIVFTVLSSWYYVYYGLYFLYIIFAFFIALI